MVVVSSPRRARFGIALAPWLLAACARDHSALEQTPTGNGGGGAAAASVSAGFVTTGAGASGGGGADGSAGPATSGTGGEGQGGARPIEPEGPARWLVVHGIADRDRLGFCFASPAGEGVGVAPYPEGGLAFAGVAELPAAVVPPSSDVVVTAVAGASADLAGVTCADLLADPASFPDLEVSPLGLVPAGALAEPRILVFAATGCLGGEDHVSDVMEAACGVGYGPFAPTASLAVASPSRVAPGDRLGFQSMGASLAAAPFDVWLRPGVDGVPFAVTEALSWGAVAPYPPAHDLDAAAAGVPAQLTAIVTLPGDEEVVLAELELADAAEQVGLSTFLDGEAITLAFVGASPGLGDGPWWHGFAAVLLPRDSP